jgi:regulator of protease activity HflC (stomatin/prohibitin superfamily)
MPGLFICALVVGAFFFIALFIGGVCTVVAKSDSPDSNGATGGAVGAFIVAAILGILGGSLVLASSFNSVGTYDIGVTTSFGKVLGYVSPGAHWIAPWENMALMDESVQPTDYTLTVRVAGQQTAQAEVKFRWQVQKGAVDTLFRQYKGNTSQVETALVKPSLNVAMNSVYDGYDPILPLSTGAKAGSPDNPSTAQLSQRVQDALSARIGQYVTVDTLVVEPLQYDQTVTDRINSVLAQTAQTDKAKEAVKTAQQQADANAIIQKSISKNPLVLAQQCFNGLADGQIQNQPGFSCWPGSSSGVVIPSAGK